ncbi:MAG: gamma-glutamyl-phosphate reductase, partial [Actinomycetota bacterium]|nr:gamma-glutamyl-phosphate reductase [Actinomycetota bacterium]
MSDLGALGWRAKVAAGALALVPTSEKDLALHTAADLLTQRAGEILDANADDVARAEVAGIGPAVVD